MRNLALILALSLCSATSLTAGGDITGNFTVAWPQGAIEDYSFGAMAIGGTGRIGIGAGEHSMVFAQFSYLDLGVERGFIPRDGENSTVTLDIYTDFYIMNFGPGFTLEKKTGPFLPGLSVFGGFTYYNTLSRVDSRNIQPMLSRHSDTDGYTWHAGVEAGTRMLIWAPLRQEPERLVDSVYFDIRLGYVHGGNLKVLNWRDVRFFGGELIVEQLESNASLVQTNIGLHIKF